MSVTKKGVARQATNIKSMSGVPSGVIATLPIGGWVYGNLSPSGTDLIDITAWYRPTSEKMELAVSCKASITNLTVTDYAEEPPPDEPPVETDTDDINVAVDVVDGEATVTVAGPQAIKVIVNGELWGKAA